MFTNANYFEDIVVEKETAKKSMNNLYTTLEEMAKEVKNADEQLDKWVDLKDKVGKIFKLS